MQGAQRDRKLAFFAALCCHITADKSVHTVLLAKIPTHAQLGAMPWTFSGALPPVSMSLSLGLNANAWRCVWKHQEGHDMLMKGESQCQSGQHFLPKQRLWLLSLRDSCNIISEFSALTGHRGHCLLTQPGQEPCHLQKGVHTFCYFHMSVSNFLKTKSNLNLVSKWGRDLFF